MNPPKFVPALMAVACLLIACGGGDEPASGVTEVEQLRGETIGVHSGEAISTLELRYVLRESYGLELPDDVTLVEAPAAELLDELSEGNVEAVVLPPTSALAAFDDDEFRVLARVADEMRDLTGQSTAASILLTYPDIATQKTAALTELNRVLRESHSHLEANRETTVTEIATAQEVDDASAQAWWGPRDLLFGDASEEVQAQIANLWQAALLLGDIAEVPEISGLILPEGEVPGIEVPDEDTEPADVGDRTTVSLAVLDDVSRRAALYAVEQGIVTSDLIDLNITYLGRSDLTEAVSARQFDVVEATPLAVPLGIERDLQLVIVSGGLLDLDGTVLLVRNE